VTTPHAAGLTHRYRLHTQSVLVGGKCQWYESGCNLQNILRQSYDYLMIMPKVTIDLRRNDVCLIYNLTSYDYSKANLHKTFENQQLAVL